MFIGLATGACKEHKSLLPLAAPCRFSCEQDLNRKEIAMKTAIIIKTGCLDQSYLDFSHEMPYS